MKKILMVILMATIVSPTFAFADNKSEQKSENNSRKSEQMAQKIEKKEIKKEFKEEKKEVKNEIKSLKKDYENDKYERHYATTTPVVIATSTATTSPSVKISKKINYFLCKTETGWNVVSLVGEKNKNSTKALSKYCMKLPYGFAKKFNNPTATTTPDILVPVISGYSTSSVASTTATASWTTNESSTGKLWYGTSTPSTLFATTTSGLTHSFSLTGLTASTTYQLLFEAKDLAGNSSTSTASLVTTN